MRKLFLLFLFALLRLEAQQNPLSVAEKITDRIISETAFAFNEVEQKPWADIQIIDFSKAIKNYKCCYAFSKITVPHPISLKFGISHSAPVKIWINDQLIFNGSGINKFRFKEIAYDIYTFQDTVSVPLNEGQNRVVVFTEGNKKSVVYIREITVPEKKVVSKFEPVQNENNYTWPWCFMDGAIILSGAGMNNYPGKTFIEDMFGKNRSEKIICVIPESAKLKKLVINPDATFKKDSYADWNYPNGILMMSIADLSDVSGEDRFKNFVKKYCDFIAGNIPQFRKQYFDAHDLRGSFYRIFRKCMLDDAGSPTLPFAQLNLASPDKKYDALLSEMVKYVYSGQTRLKDGTLCRPEPEKWTVWADDLFMAVPLFVRASKIYNDKKYLDDAVRQVINFNKYLFDKEKGIYKHGWYSRTNQKSNVFWGRANGWIIWATSELIENMPKNHPQYNKVAQIFRDHLIGLLQYQDQSGMWHQILNDKSSFEETSCTSMFIVGLSRAIRNGLIDKRYSGQISRAWDAVKNNISSDGIVKDICCGTGISEEPEFYKKRDRLDNDPRGLGAVITAALEMDKLGKFLAK